MHTDPGGQLNAGRLLLGNVLPPLGATHEDAFMTGLALHSGGGAAGEAGAAAGDAAEHATPYVVGEGDGVANPAARATSNVAAAAPTMAR